MSPDIRGIRKTILDTWQKEIYDCYESGNLCSEKQLQAELYHQLRLFSKQETRQLKVWVEPTLKLPRENGTGTIKPDLLLSSGNEVIAIVELKYVPYKEARFQDDIRKMYNLSKYQGLIRLETDPNTGNYYDKADKHLTVAKDILCVFAAICKGGFAHAVESQTVWKKKNYQINIPHNFLHLVGRVFKEKRYFDCPDNLIQN